MAIACISGDNAATPMPSIPRERALDSSSALLADPYRYIAKRCRAHGADLFEARILFRRTICMSGPLAAKLFYDGERFQRQGAPPEALSATLFGKGGVQGLDGAMHLRRKAMFMAIVAPERVETLGHLFAAEMSRAARDWVAAGSVTLYGALHEPIARAVCAWAGVPLLGHEVGRRTRELSALFDRSTGVGLGHLSARLDRKRVEHWLAGLVRDVRAGRIEAQEMSALQAVARHQDADDKLLCPKIAAVELINILRPTIAVSVFIVFAAHALQAHPASRERLASGDQAYAEAFLNEVRRWYPFFPAVTATVRRNFDWQGYFFAKGRRVMLDIYGTNHDPRGWEAPEQFRPERFMGHPPNPFNFVPQGGGSVRSGHRCPGEGITSTLMWVVVDFLVRRLQYEVAEASLKIDYSRLPALPRDGFVMNAIRLRG